jgi:hypothetical protein
MHICDTRLGTHLNDLERLHIEQCQECADQHQQMTELKSNVDAMELIMPPAEVWQKLACSPKLKAKNNLRKWIVVAALAASTSFVSFSWLMFNNYQLQNQLEQVLQVNQRLELQLVQNSIPSFKQARLLTQVREVEVQLQNAATQVEKLRLLKERQALINKMVNLQQGESNEYSI